MPFFFTFLFSGLAWFVSPFFSFFLLVPVLLELDSGKSLLKVTGRIWLHFFLINIVVLYWLMLIYFQKGVLSLALQSVIMTMPFILFMLLRKWFGSINIFLLVSLWVVYELFLEQWILGWPWLNLCNFFANSPEYILWIKYSGAIGASSWIFLINVLVYLMIKEYGRLRPLIKSKTVYFCILTACIPVLCSFFLYSEKTKGRAMFKIFIAHDAGNGNKDYVSVLNRINKGKEDTDTSGLSCVLFPETYNGEEYWMDALKDSKLYSQLHSFLGKSHISFISAGLNLNEIADKQYAKKYNPQFNIWYNTYNSVISIDKTGKLQIAYKSKLIPIEEFKPAFLKWWSTESEDYSYKHYGNRLINLNDSVSFLSLLCYEALFSNSLVVNDMSYSAILMFSSEGFFKSKGEKRDYLNITRLRAIESGKWIVKAAKNGISAVINPNGKLVFETDSKKPAIYQVSVPMMPDKISFYLKERELINILYIIIPAFFLICLKNPPPLAVVMYSGLCRMLKFGT